MSETCLKIAITKGLGVGIIAGSAMVKIPQMVKILRAGSGEGISVPGALLEMYAISSTWAYAVARQFPFTAWGEAFFLAIQTSGIIILCLVYAKKSSLAGIYLVAYIGVMYVLLSGQIPVNVLATLQACNMPVMLVSRMIQILQNYRNGHTGQLSAITMVLVFLGSLARIFTSIQETGDPVLMWVFISSSSSSGAIVLQLFWYWNTTNEYLKKKAKAE
ncbi:mannose-P-dolichol utilization defect 1 protein-like [Anneissia japonica]|uniref:mannose-P-dolichol utilization defect 1 protein-like n=1 Tax=Anneissia japonica TaxID=1529436 RepID=UPI001425A85A|nr:mannose-P-dolichol utilization defect 1 protein-like [Anneissia japonica]